MQSIAAQTYENFRVLAVNDASTDNTLDKLEEWRFKINMKIINLETNSMQGKARNEALKIADADYIVFIDVDDWVEPNLLEHTSIADITMFGIYILEKPHGPAADKFVTIHNAQERKDTFLNNYTLRSCWDKIYRRETIEGLQFMEGCIDEEPLFTIPAYLRAESVKFITKPLYHYCPAATGSTSKARDAEGNIKTWLSLYDEIKWYLDTPEYDFIKIMFQKNFVDYSVMLAKNRGTLVDRDKLQADMDKMFNK